MNTENNKSIYALEKEINLNLLSFFEYINMPPLCTSSIIIKNFFKYLTLNNNEIINFKTLKHTIESLNLCWHNEISILRNYISLWYKSYSKDFNDKYSFSLEIKKVNVLNFLKIIKQAYALNKHKNNQCFTLYDCYNKAEEKRLFDRKLIRSNLLEQCTIFEKLGEAYEPPIPQKLKKKIKN